MSSKKQIGGDRLNGELTREAQRDLVVSHESLLDFVALLTRAIREHVDGTKILARAAEIRSGPLPNSPSHLRRKNRQPAVTK